MRRIVYTSKANATFSESDLFGIVSNSARNNGAVSLTGFLLYSDRRFLQLLEGPSDNIDATYVVITRDSRHTDCHIVSDEIVSQRTFDRWTMRRVSASNNHEAFAFLDQHAGCEISPTIKTAINNFFGTTMTS